MTKPVTDAEGREIVAGQILYTAFRVGNSATLEKRLVLDVLPDGRIKVIALKSRYSFSNTPPRPGFLVDGRQSIVFADAPGDTP